MQVNLDKLADLLRQRGLSLNTGDSPHNEAAHAYIAPPIPPMRF